MSFTKINLQDEFLVNAEVRYLRELFRSRYDVIFTAAELREIVSSIAAKQKGTDDKELEELRYIKNRIKGIVSGNCLTRDSVENETIIRIKQVLRNCE